MPAAAELPVLGLASAWRAPANLQVFYNSSRLREPGTLPADSC
jgi:hypothetical protein